MYCTASLAAGHNRKSLSVFHVHWRKKEGKEVKCVIGRTVEGQDRESIWETSVPNLRVPLHKLSASCPPSFQGMKTGRKMMM